MDSHNHPQTSHNSFNLRVQNNGMALPDEQKNTFLPFFLLNLRSILCIFACIQNVKITIVFFFFFFSFPVAREESTSARESPIQDDPQH